MDPVDFIGHICASAVRGAGWVPTYIGEHAPRINQTASDGAYKRSTRVRKLVVCKASVTTSLLFLATCIWLSVSICGFVIGLSRDKRFRLEF